MPRPHFTKGRSARFLIVLFCLGFAFAASACIWDSDTLKDEIKKNPTLAEAILNPKPPAVNKVALTAKLNELLAARKEDDPAWWNNVAGAYLRLGQAADAAKLLEPVVSRFEDNYGIHANLGTAYHLLGRYAEAEKEIARDLELNPEAHFGLEKYHLALLQYLARPKDYQARHVYVDEYTSVFYRIVETRDLRPIPSTGSPNRTNSLEQLQTELAQITGGNLAERAKRSRLLHQLTAWDEAPEYTKKYDLSEDEKFQEGVIYMASLNPDEPACAIMLGLAALRTSDLNLARKAFTRAVIMGSPMEDVLRLRIDDIRFIIEESNRNSASRRPDPITESARDLIPAAIFAALCWILFIAAKWFKRARAAMVVIACCLSTASMQACIWDGDTLEEDILKNPELADAILYPRPPALDQGKLNQRLKELLANRKENDPDWWNNVAGAYLRLGQAAEAVKLLEPVVSRFEDNYGIHANLGTAYHLLGRYAAAEKEIARDLELNPEAHFGLEKYHLALLQYLARSKDCQARHLYVDEFTGEFYNTDKLFRLQSYWLMNSRDKDTSPEELKAKLSALTGTSESDRQDRVAVLKGLAAWDTQPKYASKYELVKDPKFQEGVIYMATLNPKEPACMTMLGMAALDSRDLNLAQKAFEKALLMGSPMEDALTLRITTIQEHIKKANGNSSPPDLTAVFFGLLVLLIAVGVCLWVTVAAWRHLRQAISSSNNQKT